MGKELNKLKEDIEAVLTNSYPAFDVSVTDQLVNLESNAVELITIRSVGTGYSYEHNIVLSELLNFSSDGLNFFAQQTLGQDVYLNWNAITTAIETYYNSL